LQAIKSSNSDRNGFKAIIGCKLSLFAMGNQSLAVLSFFKASRCFDKAQDVVVQS
jgi:hypothetical protein